MGLLGVGVVLGLVSCSGHRAGPPVVVGFEAAEYAGEWHEVARLPNFFERDVVAAKAIYGVREEGGLTVKNLGLKDDGERTEITGKATAPDPAVPAKLKVRFDRFPANLFAGDYWVLAFDEEEGRAMVGGPGRKYLWLLAKDEAATKEDFGDFLKQAEEVGYDTSEMIFNPKRLP